MALTYSRNTTATTHRLGHLYAERAGVATWSNYRVYTAMTVTGAGTFNGPTGDGGITRVDTQAIGDPPTPVTP